MHKDFDKWNKEKKRLNALNKVPFYHEREVWWCALGVNVGFEQDGTGMNFDRPIIVVKAFNRSTFLALPLTGQFKEGPYYFPVGEVQKRQASAVLSQLRLIDTKRLIRKIVTMEEATFDKLKTTLQAVLFDKR